MDEKERFNLGKREGDFYSRALSDSKTFASKTARELQSHIPADEQYWESCSQGLIKHLTNVKMNSSEFVLNMYIQVIAAGGYSGSHRHLSEEVFFVLEGGGYDLHWDPIFSAIEQYDWDWQIEPKRFDWQAGDFVYIPPNTIHQHFANDRAPARILSATSQLAKALMGYDGLEQLSDASTASKIEE